MGLDSQTLSFAIAGNECHVSKRHDRTRLDRNWNWVNNVFNELVNMDRAVINVIIIAISIIIIIVRTIVINFIIVAKIAVISIMTINLL